MGPRILVVGGGIGGCSTAYFARQAFPDADIHLAEREKGQLGGRVATVELGGLEYEEGGSVLHSSNKYMADFVDKELGLERVAPASGRLGLFDGKDFVFQASDSSLLTKLKLIVRYGLDPLRLSRFLDGMLEKFTKIYALQAAGKAFDTPSELLSALSPDFPRLMHETLREALHKVGLSKRFVEELAFGVVRVNYGQTPDVGAFVGSIALMGTGGSLWAVKGGNKQVAEKLLDASGATLHEHVQIESIAGRGGHGGGPYRVLGRRLDGNDSGAFEGDFDVVFLAAPADSSTPSTRIDLRDLGPSAATSESIARKYHRTVATFFAEPPPPGAFNEASPLPDTILTVSTDAFVNSVGKHHPVDGSASQPRWKVFSQAPLSPAAKARLSPGSAPEAQRSWRAYPDYTTPSERAREAPFCLDGHLLFYCNAIEAAASCMEMAVIGAKNSVLLARAKLGVPRARL